MVAGDVAEADFGASLWTAIDFYGVAEGFSAVLSVVFRGGPFAIVRIRRIGVLRAWVWANFETLIFTILGSGAGGISHLGPGFSGLSCLLAGFPADGCRRCAELCSRFPETCPQVLCSRLSDVILFEIENDISTPRDVTAAPTGTVQPSERERRPQAAIALRSRRPELPVMPRFTREPPRLDGSARRRIPPSVDRSTGVLR